MKLIQANIWGGRLDSSVVNFLAKEKADIVCLQEAVEVEGSGLMSVTLTQIREGADYKEAFFSPTFSFNLMQKTAGLGNAILSNLPITLQETIFTRLQHIENFDFDNEDYNARNLQHTVIDVNGTPLNVLNHHGHHVPSHKNGDGETLRQCGMIADYVGKLAGHVILTGDFNLSPHSESLEQINAVLDNLSDRFGLTTTRTPLSPKTEVCDYIFVSPGVTVNNFYASDELISDHKALVLDFEL